LVYSFNEYTPVIKTGNPKNLTGFSGFIKKDRRRNIAQGEYVRLSLRGAPANPVRRSNLIRRRGKTGLLRRLGGQNPAAHPPRNDKVRLSARRNSFVTSPLPDGFQSTRG
jgi:hypothetical protein